MSCLPMLVGAGCFVRWLRHGAFLSGGSRTQPRSNKLRWLSCRADEWGVGSGEWGVGSGEWGFMENNMAKVNDTWVGALGMYMVDLAQVHALSQAQDRLFGQRA